MTVALTHLLVVQSELSRDTGRGAGSPPPSARLPAGATHPRGMDAATPPDRAPGPVAPLPRGDSQCMAGAHNPEPSGCDSRPRSHSLARAERRLDLLADWRRGELDEEDAA